MCHQDYRTCQFWSSLNYWPPFEYYNLFGLCFKFTLPLLRVSVTQGIDSRKDNKEIMSSRHGNVKIFLILLNQPSDVCRFWEYCISCSAGKMCYIIHFMLVE